MSNDDQALDDLIREFCGYPPRLRLRVRAWVLTRWHRWWASYHDFWLWFADRHGFPVGDQMRYADKHMSHLAAILELENTQPTQTR